MELLTVKEVSQILGCNIAKVHELRKSGVLKFIKVGNYKTTSEWLKEFLNDYQGYDVTNPNDPKKFEE